MLYCPVFVKGCQGSVAPLVAADPWLHYRLLGKASAGDCNFSPFLPNGDYQEFEMNRLCKYLKKLRMQSAPFCRKFLCPRF
jgi:hypothetical protein